MTNERFAALLSRMAGSMRGAEGRPAGFSGISRCRLDGELIARYDEVFERAPVLVQLGFSDERVLKAVKSWAKHS